VLVLFISSLLAAAIAIQLNQQSPQGGPPPDGAGSLEQQARDLRRSLGFGASRPAAEQLNEVPASGVVRPEEFGAVGDGIHDDSSAVQEALYSGAGRTVRLASGATYLCAKALQLPSHTTLVGDRSSVLRFTWSRSDEAASGGPYYIGNADQESGNVDIVLLGFSVRGAASGLPAGPNVGDSALKMPAIRLRHVDTFTLRRLEVGYAPGISILYQGCRRGRLVENYVHDSGRDGITGMWWKDNVTDVIVARNHIERFGDDGIALAGTTSRSTNESALPTRVTIQNNAVIGWRTDPNGLLLGRGVALLAVENVAVRGNRISNSAGAGIMVRGSVSPLSIDPATGELWRSRDVLLTENTIVNAGRHATTSTSNPGSDSPNGIDIDRAVGVVAHRNRIVDPVGDAVTVHRCHGCQLLDASSV
jgi:polygalacturonase